MAGSLPSPKRSALSVSTTATRAGSGTTVATGGGYDLGRVLEVGAGRVFVWGDEWITYSSEWTLHPDYQVDQFWVNIVKWLSPPRDCRLAQ